MPLGSVLFMGKPKYSPMQKFLRLALLFTALLSPVFAQRDIGYVDVVAEKNTLPVRVSANEPELNRLALQAFGAHGRYRVTASSYQFDIRFSVVTANQVRVDITRGSGGTPVASQVFSGANARQALLHAADFAVEQTNGMGLKGFFTAQLAFIGERTGKKEVYTADLFFGGAKQITRDNALALMPRWAPDGNRLLYTSFFKSGFPDIFQIDLSTYQRTTFVSFKGTNSGARFSPNGQQVAMVLSGEGTPEIYLSNAQGRQVSRKTRSDAVKSSPCFSPDGSRIVFAMEPGPQLYVMSVAGGVPSRITSGISRYCAEPDWSRANPNKIAFTMRAGGYQIGVLDLSTRKGAQVSKAPFDGIEPSWLADGRHLVYTARDRRSSVICILDTETGKSVRVSPTSFGNVMQASVWTR
ncbi:Periplasmic component of the Tol biopolymer transport system-like protein [Opitutus terrae PB90-1]|uniref:Periplasmic component of the Tol biopolymer transport system-like protein n=2 Tax=Opitutus terrae TaxID=107709 RepID=B1ZQW0_OPITP|nr:Periplasmic component of the Tol biopolymer transport system-like protein [Opitutus terrae PB90-1]